MSDSNSSGAADLRLIVMQMALDSETGQSVQFSTNLPRAASVEDIAYELAVLREAGWREIAAGAKRRHLRAELIAEEQEKKIRAAREAGKHLDAKQLDRERMDRDKERIVLAAIASADERMLQNFPLTLADNPAEAAPLGN